MEFAALNIKATPALLLVNQHGKVVGVWVGILTPQKEREVMTAVSKLRYGLVSGGYHRLRRSVDPS